MGVRCNILTGLTVMIIFCSSSLCAGGLDSGKESSPQADHSSSKRPEVSCELKVTERYEFYDISGSTIDEWRRQMKQNGTRWNDGKVYAALATWDIRYRYQVSDRDDSYSVKSVKTDVEITYNFPRLVYYGADAELVALWGKYLASLKQHEFGHKDLAVKTAGEINEVLAALDSFSSKSKLHQEAGRQADEKLQRLKSVQVAYDDETRHGETQGAILPSAMTAQVQEHK